MGEHDGVRNREAETKTGGFIHVAGVVAAHERLQHIVLARIGNAGAIVLDVDGQSVRRTVSRTVASAPNLTAFSTRLVTLRCRSSGRRHPAALPAVAAGFAVVVVDFLQPDRQREHIEQLRRILLGAPERLPDLTSSRRGDARRNHPCRKGKGGCPFM